MDYFHDPDDLCPLFRTKNHFFAFCEQTGRSLKNFLTSFEVCCAQLESKPITSQKDLLVLFFSPAMEVEIQHILFLSASTLLHLIASNKNLVSFFHPLPRQLMAYRHSNWKQLCWPLWQHDWIEHLKQKYSLLSYYTTATLIALLSLTRLWWWLDAALPQLLFPSLWHQTKAFPVEWLLLLFQSRRKLFIVALV